MAAVNNADGKLIFLRSANKDTQPQSNLADESGPNPTLPPSGQQPQSAPLPTTFRSAEASGPRAEVIIPTRRVVVIRSTKIPHIDPGSNEAGESGKSNSGENAPVMSDGGKSVYLIRRPIPPDSFKILQLHKSNSEIQPNTITEPVQPITSTPATDDIIGSIEQARSPSPLEALPLVPVETQLHGSTDYVPRYAPYLRPSRSRLRTPASSRTNSAHRSPSLTRRRSSPSRVAEFQTQQSSNLTLEGEQPETEPRVLSLTRNLRRKRNASARTTSAKSIVLVNPDDQSVAVIENSFIKAGKVKSETKQSKFIKKTQTSSANESQSRERLVETMESRPCLDCLSKYICLIIVICLILILIGLAGVGVSLYFLLTNSSSNSMPLIIGIAVGAVIAVLALCFLCIVLGCIGARDGYFTYDDTNTQPVGGRVYALIPPTHPNAQPNVPHEVMKTSDANQVVPVQIRPNNPQRQTPIKGPVSTTKSYALPQTIFESGSASNRIESRSKTKNLTIEVPERLLPARKMSPKSRERNLTQVVQNVNQIYEDVKRQYKGDVSNKVIVTVNKNAS